jgi:NAD(P)-dependent dehydrogenase (short-subunit alcohol dehydrogenase family)
VAENTAPLLRGYLADAGQVVTIRSAAPFKVAAGPLTPDHIVYAKSFALIGETIDGDAVAAFARDKGYKPKVAAIPGKAVFAAGKNAVGAQTTLALALDASLVEQLTAAFGGVHYIDKAHREFIENWEVESYRSKVAAGSGKPMTGKVVVVTGGAQGFGCGIAEVLAAEGADVVIADMNVEGAKNAAAKLGPGADGVAVNIADEDSVAAMIREVVLQYGGIDLFVANAGVLRAGSVMALTKKDWDFVTNINYSGYFLCVKHASPVMALQNRATGLWSDIVQVNSKSGLVGSNRNGAYAGSKFGTIGLTQSFALELVSDHIKVNSVCPGNFFDGPLWSDPERGLFVQYLNTGKVPGAKTVADVKLHYESQIPMRRGCLPSDVARAIIYAVAQQYETGQAIPVAGGQVMLN